MAEARAKGMDSGEETVKDRGMAGGQAAGKVLGLAEETHQGS